MTIMRRKLYFTILSTLLCISLCGCGKNNDVDTNSGNISGNETENPDNNQENNTNKPETNTEETPEANDNQTSEIKETVEPKSVRLTTNQQYSDAYRTVKFLGLKEYKKLKGNNYTDKAKKNKKLLVLFLSIRNTGNEDDYINPNYVTAKVDGKEIEHTFLVNEPFSYPTIFTNIEAGGTIGGFIVWEVPQDWKKMKMEYSAWKNINGVTLTAEFSPDDLSEPLIYNAANFN